MATDLVSVSVIAALGGRLGPPSWFAVAGFAVGGAGLMWYSWRQGLGGSTTVAIGVIAGLLIVFELSRLL
jgi:hypothetical protein